MSEAAESAQHEREGRAKTIAKVVDASAWLPASERLASWERDGRIFGVEHDGERRYPAYQFDADGMPRAVIALVLSALPERMEPWAIAAWFVYPTDWLERDGEPCAPQDRLDHPDAVLEAAIRAAGTYVA